MTEVYPFLESKKWYLLFVGFLLATQPLGETSNNLLARFSQVLMANFLSHVIVSVYIYFFFFFFLIMILSRDPICTCINCTMYIYFQLLVTIFTNLHTLSVMEARNALHKMRCWMITKVTGHIANPQSASTGLQVLRMIVRRSVEKSHLRTRYKLLCKLPIKLLRLQ